MRAAILYNDRDIRLGQAPEPQIGPERADREDPDTIKIVLDVQGSDKE